MHRQNSSKTPSRIADYFVSIGLDDAFELEAPPNSNTTLSAVKGPFIAKVIFLLILLVLVILLQIYYNYQILITYD